MRQKMRKIKQILLIIRICFYLSCRLYFDCWDWDELMVSGFPDLNEVIQYNMVGGSGSSSSNPRWDLDLNMHPREDVEVPAEEAPELDTDVYGERDPDRIKSLLRAQLVERISQKENEIRGVIEALVQDEIKKRGPSYFYFRKLDQFVIQVIREHAQRFDPDNLENKHKAFSFLLTQIRKDTLGKKEQIKKKIQDNLLDFIVQE